MNGEYGATSCEIGSQTSSGRRWDLAFVELHKCNKCKVCHLLLAITQVVLSAVCKHLSHT